ncbi:MAG: efflux RND transporter permease subunit [Verrucomicrobiota bacterium]
MSVPELFIRRPIMTTLVMSGIIIFGLAAYRLLPVSDLPNVDFPTIQVSASLPGASPETMASSVATVLEQEFSTIAGIDQMTSSSALGSTNVTLQFTLDRSLDSAAQDVQAAISRAARRLPLNMPSPPSYQKVNPADAPILYLAVVSSTLPLSQVDEFAETTIAQRISTVNGVAQVQVFGAQKYAVRAQVDPNLLAARGIALDEVATAINGANVNLPTGTLYGKDQAFTVQATGQLENAAGFKRLIVTYRNGSPVHLEELGRVVDGVQNNKTASWFNDTRAIVLAIQRQPGTNTVAVVDAVKKLLPNFAKQMPAAMKLNILFDRSESIRASVGDVKFTLLLAICLVILVIFLFLRTVSATIIPSAAMPMSIVGTFAVMYLCGYSLDNLSLMALTLCVGFVVDDAIVVLENIIRHIENGEPVREAALRGSGEIGFTVLSMTVSLAAVFIPVLFMGGLFGRLLHEFAVTITAAILVSGFVSLTLTPMLCSRFLKPKNEEKEHGKFYETSERVFEWMRDTYDRNLQIALRHRLAVLIIGLAMIPATMFLFKLMPTGLIPSDDIGSIFMPTEGPQEISFDAMVQHQRQLAAIVGQDPYVKQFMSTVGGGGISQTGNSGRMFIMLKPRSQRPSAEQVIEELRPKLKQVPGINVYPQVLPTIRVGGTLTKSTYQFTLFGSNLKELYDAEPKLEEKMRGIPGLTDVTSDLQIRSPQAMVNIDREKAAAQGVTPEAIENTLYNAYGARQVSTIYTPTNQYWVILEVEPRFQREPTALTQLYLRSSNGKLVPLSAVTTINRTVGPLTVAHLGQLPAVTISFNLKPGVSLGEVTPKIQDLARRELPATISTGFQGSAQVFQSSFANLGFLLLMAVLVIYLVLGVLYESFIHPITILSGLPSAGFGALLTLLIFRMELNLYAFVGIIMLIGIVKKNAIMMIDFALAAERREGKDPADAIYEACLVRFRPIMMTTVAALMGTLPIAIGFGAGSESRRPLGVAVVGGLLFSQLITLFITPVIYLYLDKLRGRHDGGSLPDESLSSDEMMSRGAALPEPAGAR